LHLYISFLGRVHRVFSRPVAVMIMEAALKMTGTTMLCGSCVGAPDGIR
jgi:hypothetical protein